MPQQTVADGSDHHQRVVNRKDTELARLARMKKQAEALAAERESQPPFGVSQLPVRKQQTRAKAKPAAESKPTA